MADNQQAESGVQRLLRIGTVTLTVLGPVINPLAAQLAERLERGGKQPADLEVVDVEDKPNVKKVVFADGEEEEVVVTKQSAKNVLLERSEALAQELEDLVERGTKLSQSLIARSSEATHDLAERGSATSQDLLKRSKEIQQELGKRGKKLNKNLNKRSQKVAEELSRRSKKVTKELSKRSRQATRQISERSGTFWILSGFVVGLAAAGITAYLLIRQRVQQQQQLDAEQSFPVSQNGYLNTNTSSAQGKGSTYTNPGPIIQQSVQPSLAEENTPAIAVADQENRMPAAQSAPSNAAFIGVVGTHHYYPVSTPLDQLANSETGKNDVVYFTTEEEAQAQGYSPDL
jgi:hypothetical protein